MENAFLKKLTEITESNFSDPQFGVEELAQKMSLSYSTLRRKVSTYTGKSANQLIREIRLKKAFEILQNEEITTAEVAYRTGFNSPNYFNSCFHEFFGYPPGDLKRGNDWENREGFAGASLGLPVEKQEKIVTGVKSVWAFMEKVGVRGLLKIGLAIIVIMAGTWLITGIDWNAGQKKSIAVLPVNNLNPGNDIQSFADGLEETLLNGLSDLKIFKKVHSRISRDRYTPPRSRNEIGKELKVDYFIGLAVQFADEEYQVYITLNDARNDGIIWSHPSSRFKAKDFETQKEIVEEVKQGLKEYFLKAKEDLKKDEKANENPADVSFQHGKYFSDLRNFRPVKALELFREAVRLDPHLVEAYIGIANVLNHQYSDVELRRDTMLIEISNSIENADLIKPGLSQTRDQEAFFYDRKGEYGKALAVCSLALKGNPESPESLYLMAGALMGLGNWPKAKECLLDVLDKDFFSALHFGRLAEIHEHLRDFPLARQRFKEVLGIDPLNGPAIFGLVGISLKTEGNPAKARALLDTLVTMGYSNGMDSLRLYYLRAMIDLYEGKYQNALKWLSGWPKVIPLGPPWYCRPKYLVMAELYGLMKKPDLERKCYESARVYLDSLQERSTGNRNDPRVISALGIAWAGLGNKDKAVACAEKARELLSLKPDAWLGPYAMEDVAFIYARTGKQQEALNILKKLLSEPGPLTPQILALDPRWGPRQ